jgi:4-hydroxy-tetrahydrodipicolinate reductase
MIKAVVTGAAGRMGNRIISLMAESNDFELLAAIEAPGHTCLGQPVNIPGGKLNIDDDLSKALESAQVIIEFTSPQATLEHLELARSRETAMVIGTTGFSPAEQERLNELGRQLPLVVSPNMSLGVNLMYGLLKQAALALGDDYDVEICEAHHKMKQDAPSGTALKLAEVVAAALGRDLEKVAVYRGKGQLGIRSAQEIGIQSIRAGDIVGEHTVFFAGNGERLEIVHRAHSRDTFARGALRAARWVVGQPKGLYNMQDVLGLTA